MPSPDRTQHDVLINGQVYLTSYSTETLGSNKQVLQHLSETNKLPVDYPPALQGRTLQPWA